jgi:ketosteroid isomerase-like protein
MSEQNVEAVRQGFHALRVGGVEELLRFFPNDVVVHRSRRRELPGPSLLLDAPSPTSEP